MNKHIAYLETSMSAPDAMDSAKWMDEGISKLEQKEQSFHGRTNVFELRVFVFKNFFIQAFEAILIRGEITLKEAHLVDIIVQNYLTDSLLAALKPTESAIIHKLLLPFASAPQRSYVDEQSSSIFGETQNDFWEQATIDALSTLSEVTSAHKERLRASMDGIKVQNTPDYARLVCLEMDRNPYNLTAAQINLAKTFDIYSLNDLKDCQL